MPLKKPTGNMYPWITGIWNPVKGKCGYDCLYCYVKKWKKEYPLRLDEKELNKSLDHDNFIFVCSGCDLFHPDVPESWIEEIILRTGDCSITNKYLWHTKNPERAVKIFEAYYPNGTLCVTIESNIPWPGISTAPQPYDRFKWLQQWQEDRMITVEPVMDFDVMTFSEMILSCQPAQVNIGADSLRNNLPEPSTEKLEDLIISLLPHTKVNLKKNLKRLMPKYEFFKKTEEPSKRLEGRCGGLSHLR
jgi:DNA repair photolyase